VGITYLGRHNGCKSPFIVFVLMYFWCGHKSAFTAKRFWRLDGDLEKVVA
jgi:hypothetical protein